MNPNEDRRNSAHIVDEEFSPEYLAMLVVCGGQVRDSDWAQLPESLAARRFLNRPLPANNPAAAP